MSSQSKKPDVVLAYHDTPSFSFYAVGRDQDEAIAAMAKIIRRHKRMYGDRIAKGYFDEAERGEGVSFFELNFGDGEIL